MRKEDAAMSELTSMEPAFAMIAGRMAPLYGRTSHASDTGVHVIGALGGSSQMYR